MMSPTLSREKTSTGQIIRTTTIAILLLFIILDAVGLLKSLNTYLSQDAYQIGIGHISFSVYKMVRIVAILALSVLVLMDAKARSWLMAVIAPTSSRTRWFAAITIITIFTLSSQGLLEPLRQALSIPSLSLQLGTYSLSMYAALKAFLLIWTMLWIASILISLGEKRLRSMQGVEASNRALLIKLFQIVLYVLIFFLALHILGIDIRALTVFSGAVGIGLGFGLQKIASNFVSGLILLFEKSVEENDLVDLGGGVFGFVRKTGARYTLIETHDSREVMVPNEDFITNRVTNWTFTNRKGRIEIPIGIAYESDAEKARALMIEAAKAHPRCSKEPGPMCFMRNFGDSSIDFLLHFWVDDVDSGRMGPQSDVMFSILKLFEEHDIIIPFPQRDLHIKERKGLT